MIIQGQGMPDATVLKFKSRKALSQSRDFATICEIDSHRIVSVQQLVDELGPIPVFGQSALLDLVPLTEGDVVKVENTDMGVFVTDLLAGESLPIAYNGTKLTLNATTVEVTAEQRLKLRAPKVDIN